MAAPVELVKAPIQWIIDTITTLVGSSATSSAKILADTISPIVSICFGIHILLMAIGYARGSIAEPVWDFMIRMFTFALVLGFAFNAAATVLPVKRLLKKAGFFVSTAPA